MAKRRKRRIRIKPFGVVVIVLGLMIIILSVLLVLRIFRTGTSAEPPVNDGPASLITSPDPTEPDNTAQDPSLPEQPVIGGTDPISGTEPVQPSAFTPTPSPTFTPVPVTPVPKPTPSPTPTPAAARTPSPKEVANAQDGKLSTGGVVLRTAPNKENGEIIGTYMKGTQLKVYGESGDYYMVQVVREELFGYIAKKFVKITSKATPTPTPVPTKIPEGAVGGKVSATKVALRKEPDLNDNTNKIGQLMKGMPVYIYYSVSGTDGQLFYFIESPDLKVQAFCVAQYIKADGPVPTNPLR